MELKFPGKLPALRMVLPWLLRLIVAGVFLYAGIAKLTHPTDFHADTLNFQWIDDPDAAWIALGLPVLEVICSAAIIIPSWSRPAALILGGLLIIFLAALGRAWLFGLDLHCGCFGSSTESVHYPWKFVQNIALLLMTTFVWLGSSEKYFCKKSFVRIRHE